MTKPITEAGISTRVLAEGAAKASGDQISSELTEKSLNKVAGKDSVINQAEVKKTKDKFINVGVGNTNTPSKLSQEDTNKIWIEAAAMQNQIIPGEKNEQNPTGGTNLKINAKDIKLGGSKDFDTGSGKKVAIDTISTPEQQKALTEQIKIATANPDLKKITAPSDDAEKTTRQEKIKNLKTGTDTTKVALLDDDQKSLTSLDQNRAELNKRREEVRLAINNDNLAESQKQALKAEQKTLDESLKTIDAVPKVFATQNGARLEIKNGSNIRSISQTQITSTAKLDGYEGMFQEKDTENQTEVKVPTVQQAYDSFAKQMKESTGKDFALGANQNLVMYRDDDSVKFLIVDSETEANGNRNTIITKPIIAKRKEDGETAIEKPSITKSGTSGQETAVIEAKQFNYKAGEAANLNGAGQDININLVKDGQALTSFFNQGETKGTPKTEEITTPENNALASVDNAFFSYSPADIEEAKAVGTSVKPKTIKITLKDQDKVRETLLILAASKNDTALFDLIKDKAEAEDKKLTLTETQLTNLQEGIKDKKILTAVDDAQLARIKGKIKTTPRQSQGAIMSDLSSLNQEERQQMALKYIEQTGIDNFGTSLGDSRSNNYTVLKGLLGVNNQKLITPLVIDKILAGTKD
jgi:hypothetical protein